MQNNENHKRPLVAGVGIGLSMAIVISVAGCTSGPFSSNLTHSPTSSDTTWGGDNHAQPVYTSPTVTPAKPTLP
jgi:hypothetical protein